MQLIDLFVLGPYFNIFCRKLVSSRPENRLDDITSELNRKWNKTVNHTFPEDSI